MPKLRRDHATFQRPGLSPLLLSLPLLVLAGCDSASTAPEIGRAADEARVATSHGASDKGRPLRLVGFASLTGQDFAPGFGPPTFGRSDFGGRCSVESDFVIRFSMTGEATHLGAFTAEFEHCSRIDWQTGRTAIHDGVATFTAANGDELWDRYERLVPGSGSAGDPEDHRFVGGTGRFANASGGGAGLPVCDRSAGTCDYELEGVIVYDASDAQD